MYILMVTAFIYCSSALAQSPEQPSIPVDQKSTVPTEAPKAESKSNSTENVEKPLTSANTTVKGQITKIYKDSKRVIVTLDNATASGSIPPVWEFTNSKSESCTGKTVESQDRNVFVDFSRCSNFDQISAGTVIFPALFQNVTLDNQPLVPPQAAAQAQPETKPATSTVESNSRWNKPRFSVGLGSSASNKFKFDSVTFTDGPVSATGSESFGVDSATQIAFLAMVARESSWGFEGGLIFESKRDINSVTETVDGGPSSHANYASPKPSIQFTILEANALYRWDVVYLPFGLNYGFAEFKRPAGSTASITCTGRVGAQVGVGFIAGEHWHFELLYQQLSATVTLSNSSVTAELGTGTLGGAVFRAAFIF